LHRGETADEDEFADAVRIGRFSKDDAARIRAAGHAAIDEIERRAWPLNTDWTDWPPDPIWPIPTPPEDWDQPEAHG
jgi:hypothetical protein